MRVNGRLGKPIAALVAAAVVPTVCSIATVSASASQRGTHMTVVPLNASRSVARAFWTASKMRTAPSRSLIAIDGRPAQTSPTDESRQILLSARTSTEVSATSTATPLDTSLYTAAPYTTEGRIFGTDAAGSYSCSGTAVTSANRSVVWTAGHCVIDPETGNRATSIVFIPGYHNGNQPFGMWTAAEADVPPQWSQANGFPEGHDIAALVMSPNAADQRLTDVVGGRDIAFDLAQQQDFDAFGYPAATPFNGSAMYHCQSGVVAIDTNTSPASLGISCDMNNGSSGGGWIVNGDALNSNVTYYYKNYPGTLYGPYFGSGAANLFETASSSTAAGSIPTGAPSSPPVPTPQPSPSADTTKPLVTSVFANPARFSPNGDGHADRTKLNWTQSETANVILTIKDSSGRLVVKMTSRSPLLPGGWYAKWDGRNAYGNRLRAGLYTFKVAAEDVAGNRSRPVGGAVRIER
ncbi:MAG: hypothetical protein M3290_01080 [Actinomycetota bacterium]|nr:hypothetical protein [Actinomycetota bacterium]